MGLGVGLGLTLATTGAAKRWMVAEAVSQSVPMQPWTWTRMMPVGSLAPLRMRVGFAASSALSSGGESSLGAWPLIVSMVQAQAGATSPPSMQVGSAASALMVSEVL